MVKPAGLNLILSYHILSSNRSYSCQLVAIGKFQNESLYSGTRLMSICQTYQLCQIVIQLFHESTNKHELYLLIVCLTIRVLLLSSLSCQQHDPCASDLCSYGACSSAQSTAASKATPISHYYCLCCEEDAWPALFGVSIE